MSGYVTGSYKDRLKHANPKKTRCCCTQMAVGMLYNEGEVVVVGSQASFGMELTPIVPSDHSSIWCEDGIKWWKRRAFIQCGQHDHDHGNKHTIVHSAYAQRRTAMSNGETDTMAICVTRMMWGSSRHYYFVCHHAVIGGECPEGMDG
jgi:hypothetical protein